MPRNDPDEHSELQVEARLDGEPGVLTVTSKRVVFSQLQGVVSKRERTRFTTLLTTIDSVHADGTAVVVERRHGSASGPKRVRIEVSNAGRVAGLIDSLRVSAAPTPTVSDRSVQVTVRHVGESAAARVMFRCPYCRTVYPELDAHCPSCGAPF